MSVASASAADLSVRRGPPAPAMMAPVPVFTWTGFYAGVNLGGSFGRANTDADLSFNSITFPGRVLGGSTSHGQDVDGVIGGGQIGYNWQTGAFVFGIETDIQGSGQRGSWTDTCPTGSFNCGTFAATVDHTDKLTWFGTTRGRIGAAFDRLLVYGTGGVAYGEVKSENTLTRDGIVTTFDTSKVRSGWTLGGGVEWAFLPNWTARVEYLYMDLGTIDNTYAIPAGVGFGLGGTINTSSRFTDNIVRGAINFKF
jgi:outer membrane immunogenic protein